jgi:hypothetical protein
VPIAGDVVDVAREGHGGWVWCETVCAGAGLEDAALTGAAVMTTVSMAAVAVRATVERVRATVRGGSLHWSVLTAWGHGERKPRHASTNSNAL